MSTASRGYWRARGSQGVYDYQPLKRDRHARLAGLATGDGRPLAPRLMAEIRRELKRLELVLEMIAELEAERDAIAAAKLSTLPGAAKIRTLARLKGLGAEFATVLAGEVFYRGFANRRQLAAYVGLDASPFRSGAMSRDLSRDLSRDQGIAKAGNAKARTTMIELAWMWLRHQPDSALSLWFRDRVGDLKGRPRRIAIVALARKLLIALWRYVETGLVPDGAVLKA